MKIGLILPANIWYCPFVNIYTKILERENIDYDIIWITLEKEHMNHHNRIHYQWYDFLFFQILVLF